MCFEWHKQDAIRPMQNMFSARCKKKPVTTLHLYKQYNMNDKCVGKLTKIANWWSSLGNGIQIECLIHLKCIHNSTEGDYACA